MALGVAKRPNTQAPVRAWLYGEPDAGKTHFAKQFPRPLLLSTDGNWIYETIPANSLDAWEKGPLAKQEEKDRAFVNLVEELKTSNSFDTVILDLIEGAHRLARNHHLKQLKITHESELDWGKGYQVINESFISWVEQLFKLPLNVIVISHQAVEKIKPKNGAEYTVFKPKLDDKFHETIEGYCNLVTRVYKDVDKDGREVRKLSLTPKEHEYGINRLGSAEDLILTHNGNNYQDFIKIWQELYDKRGLDTTIRETNVTRESVEKDRKEIKKQQKIKEAERLLEEAKVEAVQAVETVEEVEQLSTVVTSTTPPKSEDSTVNEKLAKIERLKRQYAADVVEAEKKAVATASDDDIGDGEPAIERTPSAQEKLARIRMLREQNKNK